MTFVKLNWWKFILKASINILILEIAFSLLFKYDHRTASFQRIITKEGFLPLLIASGFTLLYFIINLFAFYYIGKIIIVDKKENLKNIFDNGEYSTGLFPTRDPFNYTQRSINGFISGFKTVISYSILYHRIDIIIVFNVLDSSNHERKIKRTLLPSGGLWNLFGNIKPEIELFISDLKEKGYLPIYTFQH